MTWSPERIEAAEALIAHCSALDLRYEVRSTGDDFREIVALARIGLAVVRADPETVERLTALVVAWERNEAPFVEATGPRDLVLAALREMGQAA